MPVAPRPHATATPETAPLPPPLQAAEAVPLRTGGEAPPPASAAPLPAAPTPPVADRSLPAPPSPPPDTTPEAPASPQPQAHAAPAAPAPLPATLPAPLPATRPAPGAKPEPARDPAPHAEPPAPAPVQAPPAPTHAPAPAPAAPITPSPQAAAPPAPTEPSVASTAAPAAQVAAQLPPALVSATTAPDGARTLSLRLHPETLGTVTIRVEQPADAPARVQISVERPQTLALLQRDHHDLAAALDQAGISAAGRELTIRFAPPAVPDAPAQAAAPTPTQAPTLAAPAPDPSPQTGGVTIAGGWSGDSQQPGQQAGQQPPGGGHAGRGRALDDDDLAPLAPVALRAAGPLRAGLDITA